MRRTTTRNYSNAHYLISRGVAYQAMCSQLRGIRWTSTKATFSGIDLGLAIRRPEIFLEVKVVAEGWGILPAFCWEYCHGTLGIFPCKNRYIGTHLLELYKFAICLWIDNDIMLFGKDGKEFFSLGILPACVGNIPSFSSGSAWEYSHRAAPGRNICGPGMARPREKRYRTRFWKARPKPS